MLTVLTVKIEAMVEVLAEMVAKMEFFEMWVWMKMMAIQQAVACTT
jgi:hypothetical protein